MSSPVICAGRDRLSPVVSISDQDCAATVHMHITPDLAFVQLMCALLRTPHELLQRLVCLLRGERRQVFVTE
jgi:hypothetical protein